MFTDNKSSSERFSGFRKTMNLGMTSLRFLALLIAVGLIISLVSCASPPGVSTSSQASATAGAAAAPATSTEVFSPPANFQKGGIVRLAQTNEPTRFGIPWATQGIDQMINGMVCEPLIGGTDKPGVYMDILAESHEFAPDKSSLTFHLRKGIKFSDGTDFNAQAVGWTWQHKWDDDGPVVFELSPWKNWEIIDDYTLKVNLKYWTTVLLDDFAGGRYGMLSPTAFDKNGKDWINTHPVGTGPWMYKDYSRGQYVKLQRNPNYWMKNGSPYLDEVHVLTFADSTVAQIAMKHGDFELWQNVDVDSANAMAKVPGIQIDKSGQQNVMIYYNAQEGIWKDIKMRQALEYAIDKATICTTFGKGYYIPSYEEMIGADALGTSLVAPRKYDLARAKQLMVEAGYPNGLSVTLKVDANLLGPAVLSLQGALAEAGIKINYMPLLGSAWGDIEKVSPDPGELRLCRQRGDVAHAVTVIRSEYGRTSPFYVNRVNPPNWFEDIDKMLVVEDPVKIVSMLEDLNKRAYDVAMFCPLWKIITASAYVDNMGIYSPPGPTHLDMQSAFSYGNRFAFRPEWLYVTKK